MLTRLDWISDATSGLASRAAATFHLDLFQRPSTSAYLAAVHLSLCQCTTAPCVRKTGPTVETKIKLSIIYRCSSSGSSCPSKVCSVAATGSSDSGRFGSASRQQSPARTACQSDSSHCVKVQTAGDHFCKGHTERQC